MQSLTLEQFWFFFRGLFFFFLACTSLSSKSDQDWGKEGSRGKKLKGRDKGRGLKKSPLNSGLLLAAPFWLLNL